MTQRDDHGLWIRPPSLNVEQIVTETIGKLKLRLLPGGRKVLEREVPLILAAYQIGHLWEKSPPPSSVLAEYTSIVNAADQFLATLGFRGREDKPDELEWFHTPSPTTLPPWVGLASLADSDLDGPGYEELLATVGGVRRLRALAQRAIQAAEQAKADSPSRHAGKQAQRGAILRLIGVYERAFDRRFGLWKRGGSREGPGIRFVTACFDVIGEKVSPSLIEDVARKHSGQR